MAGKSIEQLKEEIAVLEKKNKDIKEQKRLVEKLSLLKKGGRPQKKQLQRKPGTKSKIRSFLGPVGDSFDRAFG